MIRFMIHLLYESSAHRAFDAATLFIAAAVPDATYKRDCDVSRDSDADPDADVAGGGAEGSAHGSSQGDGQTE